MRAFLFASLLVACSSSSTTTTSDAASDTSSSETATDTAGDVELPSCPAMPKDGDPCPVEGQHCDQALNCGPTAGTFATCTMGKWKVVSNPCTTGDGG
jgi:hypothetical protein